VADAQPVARRLAVFFSVRWLAPTCSLLARARDKAGREPES
jgi:hypothetical protein